MPPLLEYVMLASLPGAILKPLVGEPSVKVMGGVALKFMTVLAGMGSIITRVPVSMGPLPTL